MRVLLDRAQGLLVLLSQLLAVLRLPGAALLPLLRACGVSLTVEGQKLLQEKAARLLVAAFKAYPAQVGAGGSRAPAGASRWAPSGEGGAAAVPDGIPPSPCAPLPVLHLCPPGLFLPFRPSLSPFFPSPVTLLQWGTMIDELFAHVIPHLPSGPKAPRDFPAAEDAGGGGAAAAGCHIQMITAALLQMIQVGGWEAGGDGWERTGGGCI